jgi:Lar family restriction alleviation protein
MDECKHKEKPGVERGVIKPCPFCGKEAELQGPHEYDNGGTFWRIECQTCWATRSEWPTDEAAKAAWNERAL